jgi:hypothetical protein
MKRIGFLSTLLFLSLVTGGVAYGQTEAKKSCPFNIVGTWKSESPRPDPVLFRFAADGTVTLLTPSTSIPNMDFETVGAVKYKLDKPTAPKRLDIIAARGNEVFGRGTTSMEITEFGDDGFTTIHPVDGRRTRWVRAQTNRYFLTFAARSTALTGYSDDISQDIDPRRGRPTGTIYGGPAFAMWTKLDGRKTEVQTLGVNLITEGAGRQIAEVGPVPAELQKQFERESGKDTDVMIRLELSEAEYERTQKVYRTWEKRVREKTLLYDDPYLNAMEFLRRTAESLNLCGERVKLHKVTWLENDKLITKFHVSQHPLEYVRDIRLKNDKLHVTDERFPANWRPTQP